MTNCKKTLMLKILPAIIFALLIILIAWLLRGTGYGQTATLSMVGLWFMFAGFVGLCRSLYN